MYWLQDKEIERVTDSRGFSYTITRKGINHIYVEVNTHKEAFVVSAHLKALEGYGRTLRRKSLAEIFDFSKPFDLEAWQQEAEKINKQLDNIKPEWKKWWKKMSGEVEKELPKFSEVFTFENDNLKKMFQEFFDDFSTLTIITKGSKQGQKQPTIKTEIKLSGDITSETNLSDEKLADYHEHMLTVSINLVKSYIQVIIQIIGILLPIAGITNVGAESFKGITEIIKSFNVKET